MILLECAKDVPGLLPVAFLVHAVAKNASENSDDDSLKFAQLIEALEILLLNAESLPQPLLGKFASALEKAEGLLRADAPRDFCALCAEFQECVDELSFEADVLKEVDIDPTSLFSGAGFPPPGPSEEEQAALTAAIEARRRSQAADEEETRLLQERNRLLAEQVAQMQKALEQQPPMPPQEQQTLPTSRSNGSRLKSFSTTSRCRQTRRSVGSRSKRASLISYDRRKLIRSSTRFCDHLWSPTFWVRLSAACS